MPSSAHVRPSRRRLRLLILVRRPQSERPRDLPLPTSECVTCLRRRVATVQGIAVVRHHCGLDYEPAAGPGAVRVTPHIRARMPRHIAEYTIFDIALVT
jgi:hypothetical protein